MSNFFQLYNLLTKRTEPPTNYHAWSAVAALSALLGKKCFIPQGHFTVFPNLYIVLVGDPGNRKTTAMQIAKNLVRLVETVPVAAESSTREGLIDDMAEGRVDASYEGKEIPYWQSAAFVSELGEFLGGKHINSNMIRFLTSIWDEPYFKERTRKNKEVVIRNPYFSLLGCCTIGWMNDNLKMNVITDGFTRRTIFVLEDELHCLNPWPVRQKDEVQALEDLKKECVRIHKLVGMFRFTKNAREYWDARYFSLRDEGLKHSDKVQHYFSSKHILAQKISMCLSAAVRNDMVVDSGLLKLAYNFLDQTEKKLDTVFSGIGKNELKASADKLLGYIRNVGAEEGLTKRQMLGYAYDDLGMTQFEEVFKFLEETKQIETASPVIGKPPRFLAAKLKKHKQEVSLLEQACRIERLTEPISEDSSTSVAVYPVDPVGQKIEARKQQTASDLEKGILLRGKRSERRENP